MLSRWRLAVSVLFISQLMLQCYTSDTIGCLFYSLSSRPQPWQQLRQALALPQSWEEKEEEEEEGKRVKGLTGAYHQIGKALSLQISSPVSSDPNLQAQ